MISKLASVIDQDSIVFIPNEIFSDLQSKLTKASHIAFAYSYYYAITLCYRYTVYGQYKPTQSDLKSLLGYVPNYQGNDFIIKKDGILDRIGYTTTTTDYPISWSIEDRELLFLTIKEFKNNYADYNLINDKNYKIKFPIKSFYRTEEAMKDHHYNGTFFDIKNTHSISLKIFTECMSNHNIGVKGFYLYSYLKHKNDIYKNKFNIHSDDLRINLNMSKGTLFRYLHELEKEKLIEIKHSKYTTGYVNTYSTLKS